MTGRYTPIALLAAVAFILAGVSPANSQSLSDNTMSLNPIHWPSVGDVEVIALEQVFSDIATLREVGVSELSWAADRRYASLTIDGNGSEEVDAFRLTGDVRLAQNDTIQSDAGAGPSPASGIGWPSNEFTLGETLQLVFQQAVPADQRGPSAPFRGEFDQYGNPIVHRVTDLGKVLDEAYVLIQDFNGHELKIGTGLETSTFGDDYSGNWIPFFMQTLLPNFNITTSAEVDAETEAEIEADLIAALQAPETDIEFGEDLYDPFPDPVYDELHDKYGDPIFDVPDEIAPGQTFVNFTVDEIGEDGGITGNIYANYSDGSKFIIQPDENGDFFGDDGDTWTFVDVTPSTEFSSVLAELKGGNQPSTGEGADTAPDDSGRYAINLLINGLDIVDPENFDYADYIDIVGPDGNPIVAPEVVDTGSSNFPPIVGSGEEQYDYIIENYGSLEAYEQAFYEAVNELIDPSGDSAKSPDSASPETATPPVSTSAPPFDPGRYTVMTDPAVAALFGGSPPIPGWSGAGWKGDEDITANPIDSVMPELAGIPSIFFHLATLGGVAPPPDGKPLEDQEEEEVLVAALGPDAFSYADPGPFPGDPGPFLGDPGPFPGDPGPFPDGWLPIPAIIFQCAELCDEIPTPESCCGVRGEIFVDIGDLNFDIVIYPPDTFILVANGPGDVTVRIFSSGFSPPQFLPTSLSFATMPVGDTFILFNPSSAGSFVSGTLTPADISQDIVIFSGIISPGCLSLCEITIKTN